MLARSVLWTSAIARCFATFRDQIAPGGRWIQTDPTGYAIVSRIFDSKTGQFVIIAGGLAHAGTQVPSEFLTGSVLRL